MNAPPTPPSRGNRPRVLGDEKRHYWLAVAMAQANGTDLQAALDEGRLSAGDWAELVQKCRGCTWAEGCSCWLKAQEAGAAETPEPCVNRETFEAVRAEQKAG